MINYKENTPAIVTERLILRKFTANDVSDILKLYGDNEVNTFLPWFPLKTIAESEAYLHNSILPQYSKNIAYFYAIALKESDKVIGYVNINDIGGANDIGYAIIKAFWHKGIVTEACKAIIKHLKSVDFPYLTATHDVNNPHSGEVMKKIGMQYQYSYTEQWQPKNIAVTFRMYQLNLDGNDKRVYLKYWDKYAEHFIDDELKTTQKSKE